MKILFLPDFSRGNPYQRELMKALERHHVNVNISNGISRFPLLGALKAHWKPDVVHFHWTHDFMIAGGRLKSIIGSLRFIAEILIVKCRGIKVVWTVHNILQHEREHQKLELFFNRILIRLYNQLIVHCSFSRKTVMQAFHLPERFKNKIHVIPHGHYINSYENKIPRQQARAKLGIKKEDIIFLYFGLIRPYKGVFQLIDTFQKIDNSRAQLFIVGRPANESIKKELMECCRSDNRIHTFLQFVPDEEIQVYINAADIAILPYQDIQTSGAMILAISFGKPVIAPAIGCIPEVLDEQGSFLYDPLESNGLINSMQLALSADLIRMGKHNFRIAQKLQWNDIGKQTYKVYRECLTGVTPKLG
jgi:glycosyltransferase involved in cell wall biosynthesis